MAAKFEVGKMYKTRDPWGKFEPYMVTKLNPETQRATVCYVHYNGSLDVLGAVSRKVRTDFEGNEYIEVESPRYTRENYSDGRTMLAIYEVE